MINDTDFELISTLTQGVYLTQNGFKICCQTICEDLSVGHQGYNVWYYFSIESFGLSRSVLKILDLEPLVQYNEGISVVLKTSKNR